MALAHKIMEIEPREVKLVEEIVDSKEINDYMVKDYYHWKGLLYQPIENKEPLYQHDVKSDPNFDFVF